MSDDRKVLVFEDTFTLTNYLLKEFTGIVEEAVADHGRCSVALSGGKTPTQFYTRLSQFEEFDLWHKTHIFQADERFVPHDDKESNWRMINENLLNFVPIPEANIHPIKTKHDNVLIATEEYKHELIYFFDLKPEQLPRFDLILLGCGEDGHLASLHPGLSEIDQPDRITVPVTDSYFKTERISLSLSVINNARNIIFLIQGERKAEVVRSILEDDADVPANRVKAPDGRLLWLLDKGAIARLSAPSTLTDRGEAVSL